MLALSVVAEHSRLRIVDFISQADPDSRELYGKDAHCEFVVVSEEGLEVAGRAHDRDDDPHFFHFAVVYDMVADPVHPRVFEKPQVIRMMHDSHPVGFVISHSSSVFPHFLRHLLLIVECFVAGRLRGV